MRRVLRKREGSGWFGLRPSARHPWGARLRPNDSKSGRARPSTTPPGRERQHTRRQEGAPAPVSFSLREADPVAASAEAAARPGRPSI